MAAAETDLPKPDFKHTNGYILNRLKTFSETSKWLIGGILGILLFTYDKIDNSLYKILSFVLAGIGIICLTTAYLGFKKYADYLEDKISVDENPPSLGEADAVGSGTGGQPVPLTLRARLPLAEIWPKIYHDSFYVPGIISLVGYAVLVFVGFPLFYKSKETPAPIIYNQIYKTKDTVILQYPAHANPILPKVSVKPGQ